MEFKNLFYNYRNKIFGIFYVFFSFHFLVKIKYIQLEIIKNLKLKIQFFSLMFYIIDTILHKSIYLYLKLFYFIIKK